MRIIFNSTAMNNQVKKCPVCNTELKGSIDKKFCSVQCKSASQYETRALKEKFYIEVDRQLKVNRKILKRHNKSGYTTLRKDTLISEGFNPHPFTHYWKNTQGQVYLFCYDIGFLELEQKGIKKYLLVEWQEYMRKK